MKNFFKSLGNFTLIIFWMSVAIAPVFLLIGGAVATTVWAALNFGTVTSMIELKNSLTFMAVITEITALTVTLTLLAFALKKIWQAFGVAFNGFAFGIAFSSLLSLIITIRLSILIGETSSVHNFAMFGITFALLFGAGLKMIPQKHRALLVFFGFLGKQELEEGLAWKLPLFSKMRLFDMSSQKIELIRKSDDLPMKILNSTKFKKLELSFIYRLKVDSLYEYTLQVDVQKKIESIIHNTIPVALMLLENSISKDELKENFSGSYFVALNNRLRTFMSLLSYGIYFPSTRDFPNLLTNTFWEKRACEAFDIDYLAKQGYLPKIVAEKGGRHLVYLNDQDKEPTEELMKKLSSMTTQTKIEYVTRKNIKVSVLNELERDTLSSNSITFKHFRGVFQQVMELEVVPEHLLLLDITGDEQNELPDEPWLESELKKEKKEKIEEYFKILKNLEEHGINIKLAVQFSSFLNALSQDEFGALVKLMDNENKGGHKE